MTIIAGVVSFSENFRISDQLCAQLRKEVSRHPSDEVIEFKDENSFLAKVDIGAFENPAFHIGPEGAVSMAAGDPLLAVTDSGNNAGRDESLRRLHQHWIDRDWGILIDANGVFCASHYNPAHRSLTLIADKLGLRSLYYWLRRECVVFASALRILEKIDLVRKIMDVRAVTEQIAFGYCLADRTPYTEIKLLDAGQVIHFSDGCAKRQFYWRWDEVVSPVRRTEDLRKELYEHFSDAVKRRLNAGENTVQAFLSGGLDSRCGVAALREHGVEVHSYNISRPRTYDQALARLFSEQIGSLHHDLEQPSDRQIPFFIWAGRFIDENPYCNGPQPDRPRILWSGDGGSVGLGSVYLNRNMIDFMEAGAIDDAVTAFLIGNGHRIPGRLIRSDKAGAIELVVRRGVQEEIEKLRSKEPAEKPYLFLLLNDQRRHLFRFLEDIDLHRLEQYMPFFDGEFLTLAASIPIKQKLYHSFYHQWLEEFPKSIASVPWQTYPGHLSCPQPVPEGLQHQWEQWGENAKRHEKREFVRQCSKCLESDSFPYPIMSKLRLRLAKWVTQMGIDNYSYLSNAVDAYHHYWVQCDGHYQMPEFD